MVVGRDGRSNFPGGPPEQIAQFEDEDITPRKHGTKTTKAELQLSYAAALAANLGLSKENNRLRASLAAANADIRRLNNPTGPRPAVEVENKRLNGLLQRAYDHHEVTRKRWQAEAAETLATLNSTQEALRTVTAAAGKASEELDLTIEALRAAKAETAAVERRLATVLDLLGDLQDATAKNIVTFVEES